MRLILYELDLNQMLQFYLKEDEAIWKTRPLPQHLIEGAVFNVCWLKKLRLAIMEILLSDVTFGTSLYLKEISELADDSVAEKGVGCFNISE